MRITTLVALAVTLLPTSALAQITPPGFPTARLAVFSPERVTTDSVLGKAGIAELEAFSADTNREIEKRNQQLEQERGQLGQAQSVLTPDALRLREYAIQNFELDLQRFMEDAQAEFFGIQQDLQTDFLVKLSPVVERVAGEHDVQFVFSWPSPSVFFADPRYDLTDQIIERLDEETATAN